MRRPFRFSKHPGFRGIAGFVRAVIRCGARGGESPLAHYSRHFQRDLGLERDDPRLGRRNDPHLFNFWSH